MILLLDTNAFLYFYKAYNNQAVPSKWDNKNLDKKQYLDCCLNSDKILITSETLYELLIQSLRKENEINEFIKHYNFIGKLNKSNKVKVSIINAENGMRFDREYLADCVSNNREFDVYRYLDTKIREEMKYMKRFVYILLTACCATIHSISGDRVFTKAYDDTVEHSMEYIKKELFQLYNLCYIDKKIDNGQFEIALDEMMKKVLNYRFKAISIHAMMLGVDEAFIEELNTKESRGVKYLSKVFNKITSNYPYKLKEIFKEELKNILKKIRHENISNVELDFIYYILEKYIVDKRPIRKNDVVDYLIITTLNPSVKLKNGSDGTVNETLNENNVSLITFDKTLYKFSKDKNYLYKEDKYNSFLK